MSTRAGWSIPSPVKFGTSGWRGVIAEDFTFANVRLALTAIAEHVKAESAEPTILVAYDTRFYSEEFSQLAVDILEHHGVRALLCETFTRTPGRRSRKSRKTLRLAPPKLPRKAACPLSRTAPPRQIRAKK